MKTININGKDFTLEQLNKLVEDAKKANPMEEVYKYHNTTEGEFEKLYKDLPNHVKAYQKEAMIVEFYNKGEKLDWTNTDQPKYYPWFNMSDFSLDDCYYYYGTSVVTTRLCFVREEDCREAVEKFIDIYRESRLG